MSRWGGEGQVMGGEEGKFEGIWWKRKAERGRPRHSVGYPEKEEK